MKFSNPLIEGTIIKRYKRFMMDVKLADGEVVTAHVPNTGSMKSCFEPGWKCLLSFTDNPKRKLKYGLEMTSNGKSWIGVNTHSSNKIVFEAIKNNLIPELKDPLEIRPEFKLENSRIDFYLKYANQDCFVEVKNVTLRDQNKTASFPDSETKRGQKHLQELTTLVKQGHRGVMFFLVQREDVELFRPAWETDPVYAKLLGEAEKEGVEILVYQCSLGKKQVHIKNALPYDLNLSKIS
jgi:sugar fermentation stimulation protein A